MDYTLLRDRSAPAGGQKGQRSRFLSDLQVMRMTGLAKAAC